jgi:hypothetical protein
LVRRYHQQTCIAKRVSSIAFKAPQLAQSSGNLTLQPGKEFAAEVKHLPRLAAALAKAWAKATELGLITDDNDNWADQ